MLAEPDGRWLGRAAAALGLVGTVDGAELRSLLAGVDPNTGEMLSAYHDRVRVAAYDCTYSTPKSVSVLHALGPEEVRTQVRAGHEEAAAAALGYLERRGAHVRRSLHAGKQRRRSRRAVSWPRPFSTGPVAPLTLISTATCSSRTWRRDRTVAGRRSMPVGCSSS